MSLFPAYQSSIDPEVDPEKSKSLNFNADWTRNESFKIEPASLNHELAEAAKKSYFEQSNLLRE